MFNVFLPKTGIIIRFLEYKMSLCHFVTLSLLPIFFLNVVLNINRYARINNIYINIYIIYIYYINVLLIFYTIHFVTK